MRSSAGRPPPRPPVTPSAQRAIEAELLASHGVVGAGGPAGGTFVVGDGSLSAASAAVRCAQRAAEAEHQAREALGVVGEHGGAQPAGERTRGLGAVAALLVG